MKHPRAKSDDGNIEIGIPDGSPVRHDNGASSHYIFIALIGSKTIATISKRSELRKIRNNIDKILGGKRTPPTANRTEE